MSQQPITDLCIDGAAHNFALLRQETREKSWHCFVTEDIFFCTKCLKQQKVEVEKVERRCGW